MPVSVAVSIPLPVTITVLLLFNLAIIQYDAHILEITILMQAFKFWQITAVLHSITNDVDCQIGYAADDGCICYH